MPEVLDRPVTAPRQDKPRAPGAPRDDYRAFGNMESRNGLQERVEIPLMLRALGLPRGGRVLEVGCGRGVALPVLSERLEPEELVGVDIDPSLIRAAGLRVSRTQTRASLHIADVRDFCFQF